MSSLKHLLTYPARWRRSRGFGVHSPFAYYFITRVLCEHEAAYYAYPEIAAFCPKARRAGFNEIFASRDMAIPESQLLFRVLCHFNPREIVEVGNGQETTGIIYLRAVPNANRHLFQDIKLEQKLTDNGPLTVLINQISDDAFDTLTVFLDHMMQKRETIVFVRQMHSLELNRRLWKHLVAKAPHGMGFFDQYTGIFVARKGLPRQTFEILM